jgi:23S rRNA (adenine2503-C2)-methyltransferase
LAAAASPAKIPDTMAGFPTPSSATPLAALARLLPPEKARTALRVVFSGRRLSRADFDSDGHSISKEQERGLARWEEEGLSSRVAERVRSSDGSVRLAIRLADGERIETVAMPARAACVSTQVGCAVACPFCASGRLGLARNLTVDEILEQVIHARREMRIERVLYMGMGEPTHNLEDVLAAAAALKQHAWISPYRQTLSTVGSVRAFERMARAPVKPCLALSLHSADEAVRRRLVPHASADPLREVVAAAARYAALQKKPILVEWTLLAGVNDRDEDADRLCELLAGARACVNFIRWNPVAGLPFAATPLERAFALRERVKSRGLLATLRRSSGADVDAACGQLRR